MEQFDQEEFDKLSDESTEDEGPSYDELVALGMQDLYDRLITVENVLVDVIFIVSENTMQPASMAEKLRSLLVPKEPQSEPQNNTSPEA